MTSYPWALTLANYLDYAITVVVAVLALTTAAGLALGDRGAGDVAGGLGDAPMAGALMGAGVLFFAFAGYARVATMGEEVIDPRRTPTARLGDDGAGQVGVDGEQGERALEAGEDSAAGRDEVAGGRTTGDLAVDELGDDLGVGLAREDIAVRL